MHISVLQEPILELFRHKSIAVFVDATLGAGGHSLAILAEHPEIEQLVGFDRDHEVLSNTRQKLPEGAICIHSNFCHMAEELQKRGIEQVDGILFDFGVSSMQLDRPERGFSFQQEGPLDMRMDPSQDITAEYLVNSLPEVELARIIYEYGEERASRRIAKAICQARKKARITTTSQLADIVLEQIPRHSRTHPATKTFQALRMEVNSELDSIQDALKQALTLLRPGGILAVISFHSLEDRLVKQTFKAQSKEEFTLLAKKPLVASRDEMRLNPRSRSAKLRAIQRVL